MKHDIRRKQLLDTAFAQIAVQGWDATNHRSITDALRLSTSVAFNHFPKRADLRNALMELRPELDLPVESDQRMTPGDRRRQLMDIALKLSSEHGYKNITVKQISDAAGVGHTLYAHYFGNLNQLRVDVMRAAVKQSILPVIAQGLVVKDPQAMKASPELRARAIESLTTA